MYRTSRRRGGISWGRIAIGIIVAVISLITYFSSSQDNPVTGETQHIDMSVEQEIALGLQAAPEMVQQFGGLDPDQNAQALVDQIGFSIVENSPARTSPYQFDFHLLDDNQTINAFALPGGQVFITRALFDRLETEDQLAGVLGHEIGHVVGRHSAEQIAKSKLTEGLAGAAVIATYDPENPSSAGAAQIAMVIGQLVNMKYGREDELESDFLGVCFIADTGYDPSEMIGVMEVLAEASQGQAPPEFFSTHPNPENRIGRIQEAIQNLDQCP
ncbi:MAG: M48 family peptidase [Chloroflexi bacterium]|nr:MAG: M48 family peptidase [Chloroflexota bacterium]